MSTGSIPSSPTRSRHQVSRSITERVSGLSKHTNANSSHHHHHHVTGHISSSLHRRDRSRDGRNGSMVAPQSAAPFTPRASLEAPRSEGGTIGSLSPVHSRTGSVLVPIGNETLGIKVAPGPSREEQLLREARKMEARTAGFQKSLLDLNTFSTTTTRLLDETYYNVLEKLTTLQNTIVALKDLAHESANTNGDFIAESHAVLTEAQSQLEDFGDFDEQQARVQALQDRVHGGRERIAALSTRVDVVRQRVEKWESADREWQETTRRRLKIMWGMVLGVGLLLLAVYWGARAYAPDIGGVVGNLQEEALVAKMKLEGKAVEVGLSKAVGRENGSVPSVELSQGEKAAHDAGDEALRALDEL